MTPKYISDSEIQQKIYYNKIANTYDQHYSDRYALKYRHDLYKKILSSINLENLKTLDAMCGGGVATGFLLKHKAIVYGIDLSEEQCRICSERYPYCEITCDSIINTDFSNSFFDMVIIDSLHHLSPNVDKGIIEIHRILRPGGYFLLWEPCARSLFDIFRKFWYKTDKNYFEENEISIDVKKIMRKHGLRFELEREEYGGNFAYLFVHESMLFRIPPGLIKHYADFLIALENLLNPFQPSILSLWVLALLRKKD